MAVRDGDRPIVRLRAVSATASLRRGEAIAPRECADDFSWPRPDARYRPM